MRRFTSPDPACKWTCDDRSLIEVLRSIIKDGRLTSRLRCWGKAWLQEPANTAVIRLSNSGLGMIVGFVV